MTVLEMLHFCYRSSYRKYLRQPTLLCWQLLYFADNYYYYIYIYYTRETTNVLSGSLPHPDSVYLQQSDSCLPTAVWQLFTWSSLTAVYLQQSDSCLPTAAWQLFTYSSLTVVYLQQPDSCLPTAAWQLFLLVQEILLTIHKCTTCYSTYIIS